jgi:hypothetical protein
MPCSRVETNATPKPTPIVRPSTAPKTEITTDSGRTMRRNCHRVMPTARSRPISLVRSITDSASVLTMPSTAMTSDRASSE